jgi:hypothetical protein
MDAEDIRKEALKTLLNLPPEGMVGLEALSQCAKVMKWVQELRTDRADEAMAELKALSHDLKGIATAFDRGILPNSLRVAFAQVASVAETMHANLEASFKK